jgi:hypothetical protein
MTSSQQNAAMSLSGVSLVFFFFLAIEINDRAGRVEKTENFDPKST